MAIAALSTIDPTVIRHCARCATPYDWRRSTSRSLRMTYCTFLCEAADLGGTIESMLAVKRAEPTESAEAEPAVDDVAEAMERLWTSPSCPVCGGDTYLQEDGSDACIMCGARLVTAEHFPRR